MLIGLVLTSDHSWRVEAAALGTVAWDGALDDLGTAARGLLDLLLLDADGLTSGDVAALRAYRVQRPATRILVSLPADAVPGDPAIGALVALGIYDLIQGASLAEALSHRPTYADAVRWLVDTPTPPGRGRTRERTAEEGIVERVVERRVAVSQRPALILVGGVAPGVGVTTLTVAIASHLARQGHKTVLVETAEPSLSVLADRNEPGQWTSNLDVHPRLLGEDPVRPLDLVRAREHAYVVGDVGTLEADHLSADADLTVLVLPGDPHRYLRAERWRQAHPDFPETLRVVVVGGTHPAAVADAWSALAGSKPIIVPIAAGRGWPPGGGEKREPALDAALASLLGDLVPESGPGRRRAWPF